MKRRAKLPAEAVGWALLFGLIFFGWLTVIIICLIWLWSQ